MKQLTLIFTFIFISSFWGCGELSNINSMEEDTHEVLRLYHQNGNMAAETFLLYGIRDSIHKEWFPNGNLQLVRKYNEGEIIAEKLLTIDGEIIKNIVIKDGRKYGLLFSSFCMNGVAKNPENDSLIFENKTK